MGKSNSKPKNINYSITNAVADAYISITENINQTFTDIQSIGVNCDNSEYNNCLKNVSVNIPDIKQATNLCNLIECKIGQIKMDQRVNLNMNSFTTVDFQQEFIEKVKNSLAQQAQQQDSALSFSNSTTNIDTTLTNLYTKIKSKDFQDQISQLNNQQNMFLLGGGHILNADLSQVTEYISNQVQIFPSIQTELKDLESNILQESMEISEAGLNELIVWIG